MKTADRLDIPKPNPGERPSAYADRLGTWYADSRSNEHRKSHGLYLTPVPVARFMAEMFSASGRDELAILDPAAGAGVLLCGVGEWLAESAPRLQKLQVVAYEIDPELAEILRSVLNALQAFLEEREIATTITVHCADFILANAHELEQPQSDFLRGEGKSQRFDLVIANPPYLKISKDDPRAQAAKAVVHGQPNIYGLFMAVGAALLKHCGDFVFITPRSFASGPYFRLFREFFFATVRPLRAHVFTSRREAFSRDEVLQENVILHARVEDGWAKRRKAHVIELSASAGSRDLGNVTTRHTPLAHVLSPTDRAHVFKLPVSIDEETLISVVDRWPGSLHSYGLQISTGPVVPFRATELLVKEEANDTVPLLWMNHVRAMEVHWPNGVRKPQYIQDSSPKLLVPNRNYVLLRRFSAKEEKRRLTAAPLIAATIDSDYLGLENHLNYIHRPGGTLSEDLTWGLAALYNSVLLDNYFRCINGNTQVSATELRAMPLPPLEAIEDLGRQVKHSPEPLEMIDALVLNLAGASPVETTQLGAYAIG